MEEKTMSDGTALSATSRIEALLDANSFVELGAAVTARSTDFNVNAE
jgi:acetyl-CoA carboxylase carboxyltransferase component